MCRRENAITGKFNGQMTLTDYRNFKDLFGGWSALTLVIGLLGALVSYLSTRRHPSQPAPERKTGFVERLPWLMGMFSAYLGLWLVPMSMAGGGPIERSLKRDVARYDIYFASLISFTFGFVFAVDVLRFQATRQRFSSWLCVVLYVLVALFLLLTYGGQTGT